MLELDGFSYKIPRRKLLGMTKPEETGLYCVCLERNPAQARFGSRIITMMPNLSKPDGRLQRVREIARRHWLGEGGGETGAATSHELRFQYQRTAEEYRRAALSLYDALGADERRFSFVSRNAQLFLAYLTLWEAFEHIYQAASFTRFCNGDRERAPLEPRRDQIRAVLSAPYLLNPDFHGFGLLRNGETPDGALTRLLSRSSREMQDTYSEGFDQTLTDTNAFLSGVVQITTPQSERETWTVRALDDQGQPLDPDAPFSGEKYRGALTWHAFQIRHNINFIGKSAGGIDDAILIIRSFCLLEPVVAVLLSDSKKAEIFAL